MSATPRPWKAGDRNIHGEHKGKSFVIARMMHCTELAGPTPREDMIRFAPVEEIKDNQALIVTAVNAHDALVEACRSTAAALEAYHHWKPSMPGALLYSLRAALALADPQPRAIEETKE